MEIQWDRLLCPKTLREKEKTPSSWVDYPMDPFEQDYREIIFSASFRRLQDKAQVSQMTRGDFIRTRLTHSLEVSTVAKQLSIMLIYNRKWNHIPLFRDLPADTARAIPTVLACAGLLHDVGNPPFGHEGEYCIGSWFARNLAREDFTFRGKPVRAWLSEQMCRDLETFEGNAQVVRLLGKARFPSSDQEANVTYATLSVLIKYPVSSLRADAASPDLRLRKLGYFLSEEQLVREVREKTGLGTDLSPVRNPPHLYSGGGRRYCLCGLRCGGRPGPGHHHAAPAAGLPAKAAGGALPGRG